MSITDELRRVAAKTECANGRCEKLYRGDLERIAERIEARYERALRESYDNGYASADDWIAQHEDAMEEHGWIRLPLDADGVPIRIGDVLDEIAVATYPFVPAKVVGYHECCGEVLPIVENDGEFQVIPEKVCHYHAPTVEDVLREFGDWYAHVKGGCDEDGIIAEYAAKLLLVEGAEQ